MSTKSIWPGLFAALLLFTTCAWSTSSEDKLAYDRQSAARYMALFKSLDRNADRVVTQSEAHGDVNFSPRFDDMDIDRDGVVTVPELQRFIEQRHGVQATLGHQP